MSGIYAGDGDQLSLAATFPQLRQAEREHGSLIRGVLANKTRNASSARRRSGFLTPVSGMAELVQTLQAGLGQVEIRLGARVSNVMPVDGSYLVHLADGELLAADAVILATPRIRQRRSGRGLRHGNGGGFGCHSARIHRHRVRWLIRWAQIPRPLDAHGYLIPRVEGRTLLACTFTSVKFQRRAPEGFALIRAFVGRAGQEDVLNGSDEDLLALVRAELRRTLGITAPAAILTCVPLAQRHAAIYAGPIWSAWRRLNSACPRIRVYLWQGNAYRGVGIPDCIASGEAAAEQVTTFLNQREHEVKHEHATVG